MESNLRPTAYKAVALPSELQRLMWGFVTADPGTALGGESLGNRTLVGWLETSSIPILPNSRYSAAIGL